MIGICKHCGRKDNLIEGLCRKHYEQKAKYGKFLDSNPRTKYDPNEYTIKGNYTKVYTYDKFNNLAYTFIIDTEDLPLVLKYKWNYTRPKNTAQGKIVYMVNRKIGMFHRYIMGNPRGTVDHINRNTFDNRKANLRVASYTQQNLNTSKRSSKFDIKGINQHKDTRRSKRFMARLSVNGKTYRSAWYKTYAEAVFARFLLQQLSKEVIMNGPMERYINTLTEEQKRPIINWFKNRFKDRV